MKLERNFLRSRKAQFFVLTAFAIVAVVFLISRWLEPFTIIDTSSVVLREEPFIFNNIVEKAIFTVNGSKSCEDLEFNIFEYKQFVESYSLGKNLKLDFNYTVSPCFDELPLPALVEFKMKLSSDAIELLSTSSAFWEPK